MYKIIKYSSLTLASLFITQLSFAALNQQVHKAEPENLSFYLNQIMVVF